MRILKNHILYFSALIALTIPSAAFAQQVECMAMPVCPAGTTTVDNCDGKTDCEPSSMCGKTVYCLADVTKACEGIAVCDATTTKVENCDGKTDCRKIELCGTVAFCEKNAPKVEPTTAPTSKPGHHGHGKNPCEGCECCGGSTCDGTNCCKGKCDGDKCRKGKTCDGDKCSKGKKCDGDKCRKGKGKKCKGGDKCRKGKKGHHGKYGSKHSKFTWQIYLTNEIYTANNRDFVDVNNDTFIDSFDTDDRFTIGKSSISLDASYRFSDDVTLNVQPTYREIWGGEGSGVFLRKMNVDWTAFENGSVKLSTKIGPQPFKIGGADKDFFFSDIATGATVTADFGKGGRLRVLALDISALADPRQSSYSSFNTVTDSRGGGTAKNFDGDTFTYRTGAVYELTELVKGLEVRAFGFFADIGTGEAPHSGSDRSFHGSHANFSDNDFNWIAGVRAGYNLEGDKLKLHVFGEYARSGGLDRKAIQIGVRDISADGNAFGVGIKPELDLGAVKPRANLRFFLADGADHTSAEGLTFNYGFVGFNGDQIGGHTVGKGSGWRPTAVLSGEGLTYNPNDFDRQSGTMMLNASIGATIMDRVTIDGGFWFYQDTSSTGITDFDNLSQIAEELPFGYTEADLEGQERYGKTLGMELEGKLGYIAKKDVLNLFVGGGIFLPGDFYKIKIDRTSGTSLGSENPVSFWALSGGATLKF